MPAVHSKPVTEGGTSFIKKLFSMSRSKIISASVIAIVLYLIHMRMKGGNSADVKLRDKKDKKGKGNVDSVFFQRLGGLLKIVVPHWKTPEVLDLCLLTSFLVLRTFLSIYISTVNGRIVKAIISMDYQMFLRKVLNLALCAVPASFVNSYLDYLNKRLAIHFRSRLSTYFNDRYIKDMVFYKVSNIDARIPNPDQRLTTDIEKWSTSLANLYSNVTKPILDIILFSQKLSEILGWKGPGYTVLWYFCSGLILRFVSPSFGRLTAVEQQLEGDYRACHTDLLHHAEEIAFYRGHDWERKRVNDSFNTLVSHSQTIINRRLYMGVFDTFLVKYGAVLCGYAILGMPVFGSGREEYLKKIGNDASAITRDYVRNSSLLINLAKGIGRLVVSYKEVQSLAGYTTLVYQMEEVLGDLEHDKYQRVMVNQSSVEHAEGKMKTVEMKKGETLESDTIRFEDVPITTPNGDILVEKINFEIEKGMNVIISGPNGCGKSSLFRILGNLWPVTGGKLHRPSLDKVFYIPQRPYLPPGNLRDQVIYPHSKLQMMRKRIKDDDIKKLLETVQLGYLADREKGLESTVDWNDVLSGGEKQRMAMARLFYHKPQFAILDECTSACSMDIESLMYTHSRELGITLFTVSHRQTLFKFHEYMLKFDGEGGWNFTKLEK